MKKDSCGQCGKYEIEKYEQLTVESASGKF